MARGAGRRKGVPRRRRRGRKGQRRHVGGDQSHGGSITYNEWSFAQAQHLNMAKIITSAGPEAVAISTDSVGKTIAGATISGQGNDLVLDTVSFYRPTKPGSYPIVLATYEIVCSKYPDAQVGTAVKAFLQSTIGAGQNGLGTTDISPFQTSSSRGCRPRSTPSRDLRPRWREDR